MENTNRLESEILEVQEWAYVYFVRFTKGRPTFVSKKAIVVEKVLKVKITAQYHLTQTERRQIKQGIEAVGLVPGAKWTNRTRSKTYEVVEVTGSNAVVKVFTKGKNDYGKTIWTTQKAFVAA